MKKLSIVNHQLSIWLKLSLFGLFLFGCTSTLREAGLHKTDFAEINLQGCTYRLHCPAGEFVPGEPIEFLFSIINETDSLRSFNLNDNRFLYVWLKNPNNQIFYKERITADRFFKEKELTVAGNSSKEFRISVQPEKNQTDTISSIYCQAQLTLLPKGLEANRLSFYIRRK